MRQGTWWSKARQYRHGERSGNIRRNRQEVSWWRPGTWQGMLHGRDARAESRQSRGHLHWFGFQIGSEAMQGFNAPIHGMGIMN